MSIQYHAERKCFYLDGKDVTYAFRLFEKHPEHLYYGKKIPHEDLNHLHITGALSTGWIAFGEEETCPRCHLQSELITYGRGDYREPCVQVQNAAGDRLSEPLYVGHEILPEKPRMKGLPSMAGGETLVVHLRDDLTGFEVDLYYTVYDDCDVIARRAVYRNAGNDTKFLRRAYSFTLPLRGNNYDILSLHGAWVRERRMETIPMHHGVVSIDSKKHSSSDELNPFMGVLTRGSDEHHGNVYGVSLVYSSSYVLKAEGTMNDQTILTGGVNDFDFTWKLEPGEEFETPEVVIAFSSEGLGGMSRAFHDAYRNHLINPRFVRKSRPIVINNWEGTYFDFNFEKLKAIIDGVEGTGIDTFVLDDGWFGENRVDEKTGLGDWHIVNQNKLPGGLKPLADYIHSKGMKFGLWFEPENVGPDSDLNRTHPDFAIRVEGRKPGLGRWTMSLDLTRKDVRDYLVETVNRVIRENDIDYVKWDYNRCVTDPYSLGLPADRQAEFAYRYALGVYDLFERIINANPDVIFEGCAGGGSRFDPAVLHYFPQIWTSDNSDAEERTLIQYGTSIVYPLSSMSCHVSDIPHHNTNRTPSMATRAAIAHLGATGYELDASKFTDEIRAEVAGYNAEYRACEDLILNGDLYRLDNPMESPFFTYLIVSKDKNEAVLVAYRGLDRLGNPSHEYLLRGLDPNKNYRVEELDKTMSGAVLMNAGIYLRFAHYDFTFKKFHIKAVD